VRVVLCSHHSQDTQSRSTASFNVALKVDGLAWKGPVQVRQCRFDSEHNSYFTEARALRDDPARIAYPRRAVERIQRLACDLVTEEARDVREADGSLTVTVPLAGNGLNILSIRRGDSE
jgi:hypothetical protein